MGSLRGKTAVVVGASANVGRATVGALLAEGARVIAVARGAEGLASLRAEHGGEGLETYQGDGSDPVTAERLVRGRRPDLVVLAGGVRPAMGPVDELSWKSFSEAWESDMQSTFHFVKAALDAPLAPGSSVVILSSGAAINGSHLSGGYAGAKRMQWLLAGYAQQRSEAKKLGLRFVALLPKQLIEGTTIGQNAAATYGATMGKTAADYMKRFTTPLDAGKVARAIVGIARGDAPTGTTAMGVTGEGVESLA